KRKDLEAGKDIKKYVLKLIKELPAECFKAINVDVVGQASGPKSKKIKALMLGYDHRKRYVLALEKPRGIFVFEVSVCSGRRNRPKYDPQKRLKRHSGCLFYLETGMDI
ncbi:MAG: hypothetical protein GTN40_05600, partial [Candidatus Aenigmarchaeota archaeon]|nr:hypothetical protein [Candidatus Aenigmarchaeota archaeon]